jgi:hypothetical protein
LIGKEAENTYCVRNEMRLRRALMYYLPKMPSSTTFLYEFVKLKPKDWIARRRESVAELERLEANAVIVSTEGELMNKSAGSLVHRASNMLLIQWLGKLEPRCTRRSAKRVERWSTVPSSASRFGWEPTHASLGNRCRRSWCPWTSHLSGSPCQAGCRPRSRCQAPRTLRGCRWSQARVSTANIR